MTAGAKETLVVSLVPACSVAYAVRVDVPEAVRRGRDAAVETPRSSLREAVQIQAEPWWCRATVRTPSHIGSVVRSMNSL